MSVQEDKTLAARIAEGNSQAENELFFCLRKRIQFLVRVRLKEKVSLEDQEDLVSEIQEAVLLRLRKGGYDPEQGKSLEAYTAGIVVNIVGQYFRKLKKEKIVVSSDELIDSSPNQENILTDMIVEEHHKKIRECLRRLKPKYREVLLLRIYEMKSIEEIAQKLRLKHRRVSERIHYAFKLMVQECKRDDYFE